jgi:hypothetical protein
MAVLDHYTLLDQIGTVARSADPTDPQHVSQRAFDIAAARSDKFSGLPRAARLTRILRQGWRDLLELSLREPADRARTLAMRTRVENATWLTHDQAEFALRLVCRRLGGVASMTPADYRRERDRAIAAAGGGGNDLVAALPDEHQIAGLFGDWDRALVSAGLPPRAAAAPAPERITPTIVEVLDRCYEAHGTQPTLGELVLFARANRIPFPRKTVGRPFADYVEEWKDQRRAAGMPVPDRPPAKRDRPDYSADVGAGGGDDPARIQRRTTDELIPWLIRFLDQLPSGSRPTQRRYGDWATNMDGAPSYSTLGRHGGFTKLMDRARRERAAGRRGPADAQPPAQYSGPAPRSSQPF